MGLLPPLPASGFLLPVLLLLSCTNAAPVKPTVAAQGWVSLSPSMTEILFAVGAGSEVVGVCAPADYPQGARTIRQVASWERTDVEGIVALAPGACFTVSGMQGQQVIQPLRRLGIPVVVYPMRDLDDLWRCMEDVGRRTDHGAQAEKVVADLRRRVASASVPGEGRRPSTLVVVGLEPLVAAAPDSFLNDVLAAAGYRNALRARGEAYPVLSLETVAASSPDAVVFSSGEIPPQSAARFLSDLRELLGRPVRTIMVPADLLVRPGPRTVEAIEILAKARRGEAAP